MLQDNQTVKGLTALVTEFLTDVKKKNKKKITSVLKKEVTHQKSVEGEPQTLSSIYKLPAEFKQNLLNEKAKGNCIRQRRYDRSVQNPHIGLVHF